MALRGLSSQLEKRTSSSAIIIFEITPRKNHVDCETRATGRRFRDILSLRLVLLRPSPMNWLFLGFASVLAVTLVYRGHGYWAWVLGGLALLPAAWSVGLTSTARSYSASRSLRWLWFSGYPPLRRQLVTRPLMPAFASALPPNGRYRARRARRGDSLVGRRPFLWRPRLAKAPGLRKTGTLGAGEVFLDGPVEELCGMLNDWEITQARRLPTEAWEFMKKHRFWE